MILGGSLLCKRNAGTGRVVCFSHHHLLSNMFLLVVLFVGFALAAPIESLPGYSGPALSMDSGYIPVGGSRHLFYWLIESQVNASSAPLLFWYQGGPGCSSLSGLFTENGPLRPNVDGGLDYNSLSLSNFANVVYVESPAFVGFSVRLAFENCTFECSQLFYQFR